MLLQLAQHVKLLQDNWFVCLFCLSAIFFVRHYSNHSSIKPTLSDATRNNRPSSHRRPRKPKKSTSDDFTPLPQTGQPYDAFLVLDVEATCREGTDLNYPNEIIEFPICLLRWKDSTSDGRASKLEIVDEFRSFVKPTWRPTLAKFCTELTGVTQDQVNNAPLFPEVLTLCRQFLVKNGLIDCDTGHHLVTYCWCSDGPFDVRDFVVKQCFISKIVMPEWLQGDVLDIRMAVNNWLNYRTSRTTQLYGRLPTSGITRRSLNISAQLKALGLSEFQGRQHCGIDDCRNISRVLVELARRGISLQPNTVIYPDKRWHWMGKPGQVLDYALT